MTNLLNHHQITNQVSVNSIELNKEMNLIKSVQAPVNVANGIGIVPVFPAVFLTMRSALIIMN